jgi:antitoxin component YwqK of YwqJK toxin-antitoxin module
MRKYIYILFAISFLYSCNTPNRKDQQASNKIKNESKPVYISYSDSGIVKKYFDKDWNIVHYKEKAEYYRIATYLSGKIVSTVIVKDYYINGVLQFEGYLISENPDINNGVARWFDSNGAINSEKNYSNGVLHGNFMDYYSSGNPKLLKHYSQGSLVGTYIEYYDTKNKIKSKGLVQNQAYNGKYQSYYENGNSQLIGNFHNGDRQGLFKSYYENGTLQSSEQYQNGKLNGDYSEHYQSGRIKTSRYYSNGEASNTWYYYDDDGDYKKYQFIVYRTGAICNDGSRSSATGRGACSWHGGVQYWLTKSEKTFISGTGKYKNYNPNNYGSYQ